MKKKAEYRRIEYAKTNTLRIVIPSDIATSLKLNAGDYMKIKTRGKKIIMEKME